MKWLGSFLALAAMLGFAQAAPPTVLHILNNGYVRFGDGPELNMDKFKAELRKRSAQKSLPEMTLGLDQKPNFAVVAAVLAEMQKSGVKIGFVTGPHR